MASTIEERVSRLESVYDRVATKDDLEELRAANKADLEEHRAETKADLEELRAANKADLEEFRAEHKRDLAELESRMATKEELNRLRADVAPLKAAHARNAAVEQADFIAEDMGFELRRVLNWQDIKRLLKGQDVSDISRSDIRSFRMADLIMEVVDEGGQCSYVAVEISFTADSRDTTRAIRNAEFMNRFTGWPARAAIAGIRRDNEIVSVESSLVYWYELDKSSLEVE